MAISFIGILFGLWKITKATWSVALIVLTVLVMVTLITMKVTFAVAGFFLR